MIVTRITGGLGNQMFEYAFGLYLAHKHQTDLFLDCSAYEEDSQREFVLDRFAIAAPHAGPQVRKLGLRRYGGQGWRNYLRLRRPLVRVREKVYGYRPDYVEAGDHSYLDGYWQSEKFFPGVGDLVCEAFQPAAPMSAESLTVARRMEGCESASIHVRRTDYLQAEFSAACSTAYYRRCVDDLRSRYTGLKLFVFSDDVAWCQQELRFACPTEFVTHNDSASAHEDMWLMTRCRHHVVANSTFSWWGAWLGVDPTGEVLAPDPWFTNPRWDGSSIVPSSWRGVSIVASALQAA